MRTGSLSRKLRRLLLFVVTVMTIAFLVSTFLVVRKEERDSVTRESEMGLLGVSGSIASSLEGYLELSRLIMMDSKLAAYLRADSDVVDAGLANDARYGVQAVLNVTNGVDSVYIFRRDGIYTCTKNHVYVLSDSVFSDEYWPVKVLALKGKPVIYVNGNGALKKVNGQAFIAIERAIYDLNSQDMTGYLSMMISRNIIEQVLAAQTSGNYCVLGRDGTYVCGNSKLGLFYDRSMATNSITHRDMVYQERRVMISCIAVKDTPLVVVCMHPLGNTSFRAQSVWILIFLMTVVSISLFTFGRYVGHNVTRPVLKLSKAMEIGKNENELVPITDVMPDNEIGLLKDSYNSMVIRIRELIQQLIAKEQSVQKAELRVLQEQIKPHFLYNSIGTISALALENGCEDVSAAIETLGRFYRNFLSKGDREITLEREITIVKDYLSLQKLRYGDIIQDEYDISDDSGDCIVPKLILQPLVENSIYHGIRQKGEAGVIRISAYIEGDDLHLTVYDTGVGMSKETAESLISRVKPSAGAEESFGLWGTIERVRYYAHRDDVVKIESEEGEYSKVELIIPVVKPGEEI